MQAENWETFLRDSCGHDSSSTDTTAGAFSIGRSLLGIAGWAAFG